MKIEKHCISADKFGLTSWQMHAGYILPKLLLLASRIIGLMLDEW